jgi:hypothetical protein
MKHLVSALFLVVVMVVGLTVAAPALTRLMGALVPLVLVAGIVAAVLRLIWAYTRRW